MHIVSLTETTGKIVWDREDWLAGYAPSVDISRTARVRNETGALTMQDFDTHLTTLGYAYPGPLPTTVGTAPTGVLVSAEIDDAAVYAYLLGPELHRYDVTTDTLSSSAGFPHTIDDGHAGETGALGQVVAHRTKGTASAIFYSFNDDTDGNVGVYYTASGQFHGAFMSAVPSGGAALTAGKSHPLLVTSDDLLLMGDANKVHAYKQLDESVSRNALNLPSNYEVVGMVEDPIGYDTWVFATTARGTNRRGRSKAFVWSIDRPASYYKSPPIPDDEVAAPFVLDGFVGCFTRSRSVAHKSVLRLYENGEWKPKYYFTGDLPAPGGVDIQNNTVIFNTNGVIHRWGPYGTRTNPASHQFATIASGTNGGFLRAIGTNSTSTSLYGSSGSGNNGVVKFSSNYATSATWQGCESRPDLPFGKKMKVTAVAIQLHYGGAVGRSLNMSIITEGATGAIGVFTDFAGTSDSKDTIITYQQENFSTRDDTYTASIAPLLSWGSGSAATSAPGIEKVEIYYELVDYVRS